MGSVQILDGPVIEAGESLSDAIDCSAGRIVRITTPAAWDNAKLSFMISTDNVSFSDLYDMEGEVTLPCGPGRGIMIHQDEHLPGMFLKFRSGTAAQPVTQSERRQFAVALLVEEGAPAARAAPPTHPHPLDNKIEQGMRRLQEQIDALHKQQAQEKKHGEGKGEAGSGGGQGERAEQEPQGPA